MKSKIFHRGMWQIPYKATNVLCPDGQYRTVKILREADTFFTIPASVQVRGKTVTGFISHNHNDPDDVLSFWGFGRNMAAFFPDFDDAYKFIQEKIVPNKGIENYELRDVFHGKWIITFVRHLDKDWTGADYEINGHKVK